MVPDVLVTDNGKVVAVNDALPRVKLPDALRVKLEPDSISVEVVLVMEMVPVVAVMFNGAPVAVADVPSPNVMFFIVMPIEPAVALKLLDPVSTRLPPVIESNDLPVIVAS